MPNSGPGMLRGKPGAAGPPPSPLSHRVSSQPLGTIINGEHLDGSRREMRQPKTWQSGRLWGQAADKSPRGSARWRGWGQGGVYAGGGGGMLLPNQTPVGTAEPGDEALEALHICCFICLLLSCCFTGGGGGGRHKSVKQPVGKQRRRSLAGLAQAVPDGGRWRRKLWRARVASPPPPSPLAIT